MIQHCKITVCISFLSIDKDAMQSEDNNDNDDEWTDEGFDEFYDKLVDVKHDEGYQEQCSRIFDYAGHMFSLVCTFVLSDLEKDLENRRGNPLAKSYPGKLKFITILKFHRQR